MGYTITSNIYKTIGVYKLVNNGKTGVITLGTMVDSFYNYYKQFENDIATLIEALKYHKHNLICYVCYDVASINLSNLQVCTEKFYNSKVFIKRVLRNINNIKPYIKYKNLNSSLNPLSIGNNIYYDAPFFQFADGKPLLIWTPVFEKNLTTSNFKVIDNCFLYEYKDSILLLVSINKRHIMADIYERLAIDLNTHRISLRFANVININTYLEFTAEFVNNKWNYLKYNETYIYGYKSGGSVN